MSESFFAVIERLTAEAHAARIAAVRTALTRINRMVGQALRRAKERG